MCLCWFKNSVVALEFVFRKGCLRQKVITAISVQNECLTRPTAISAGLSREYHLADDFLYSRHPFNW